MPTVTIDQIDERLRVLPPEKLMVVYDFVSYLAERDIEPANANLPPESLQTMFASEAVLRRDWDRPEEDLAWASL